MKQEYGVYWPTAQELADLLKEGDIKGPLGMASICEIHRREPEKTIEYHQLGKQVEEKYKQSAASMALKGGFDQVFYNRKHMVSTSSSSIIIAMDFDFYQSSKIEVYRLEE